MLQHAVEALRLAQPSHHAALARVSLVVADAFHFAGRFDLAKPWYAAVREHALAEGDDAMISAMLHNVAALRANQVRLADAFHEPGHNEANRALMELDSTKNYDLGIGTLSLGLLIPLVRAQLFMALGRFPDAVSLYSETLDKQNTENLERREACFFAERAWCLIQTGKTEDACADVDAACRHAGNPADPDDVASMHARLAEVLNLLGQSERSLEHKRQAIEFRRRHMDAQAELLGKLEQALSGQRNVPT
jgi:tetratricopeptide (TPR) repeat protein